MTAVTTTTRLMMTRHLASALTPPLVRSSTTTWRPPLRCLASSTSSSSATTPRSPPKSPKAAKAATKAQATSSAAPSTAARKTASATRTKSKADAIASPTLKSTPRPLLAAQSRPASSVALSFPCLERNKEREESLVRSITQSAANAAAQGHSQAERLAATTDADSGPEPAYSRIVSGYKTFSAQKPLHFVHGGSLPQYDIAYETWGELNADKDNAILLFTGLSGSSHAKSHPDNPAPGWWENFIGPGYPLDTNKFHIICTNVIGGCYGSTGPSSIDPVTKERYGTRFPIITIWDMVRAQFHMLDSMGIKKLHAAVGSSMGGMQSLAAASMFPDRVGRVISISAAARSHPYSIAMRYSQRQVLMSDPNWANGHYYKSVPPHVGMKLARQIATITYRSGPEWELRFGRKKADPSATRPAMCADFLIETYLDHQGEKWCLQYDANSFIYISKAMDLFDMSVPPPSIEELENPLKQQQQRQLAERAESQKDARKKQGGGDGGATAGGEDALVEEDEMWETTTARRKLMAGMQNITMPALVLGVQSDILFPCWQQKEIAQVLRSNGNDNVTFYELDAIFGHDTFLIDRTNVGSAVKGHLEL